MILHNRICETIKENIPNRLSKGCSGANSIDVDYSIQTYDSQYVLIGNDATLTDFDYTDSYSVSCKFRWDKATNTIGANAIVLLENRNQFNVGWQLALLKATNQVRWLVSNGTLSNIIIWDLPSSLVLDDVYAVSVTQNGSGGFDCFVNGTDVVEDSSTAPVNSNTNSNEPFRIGTNRALTSNVRFRGLMNDIMFTNHYLSLSEHNDWLNSNQCLKKIKSLDFNGNIVAYFNANNYNKSTGFESLVDSNDVILTPDERDYFQLPYDLYSWNPTPTINATNYGSNPIVDGTSFSSIESYAGDACTAPDGDIVAVCKSSDSPVTQTRFHIFKGADFDNLVEINSNSYPFPNWPINEVGTIRIRREGNTYYLIVRRQLTGSTGGSGERDVCILETTDLTTNPSTWTQYLGVIDKDMIPFEDSGTGDWDLFAPSDLFKYRGKYYMTCYCGNLIDYMLLFESDSITSGWSYKKTIFSVNEQDWLNTLSPNITGDNVVQGGSIIKDGDYFYCCVTIGMASSDNKDERYLILGRGETPFEFEFYKTVLHQSGADGTYFERRVYDGQFIKKSDGQWLKPELIDSKYWLTYSGHSYIGNRPQAWDSNGKLSLISFTPGNLIS